MTGFSSTLLLAALSIGFVHTLLGPDHYLPFVLLSRARGWSRTRTLAITAACGIGHVAGSVLLGAAGLALGVAVGRLEATEGSRGDIAAWVLVAFGLAYAVWGTRRALRQSRGIEPHEHGGHVHLHSHGGESHVHQHGREGAGVTFWALLVAFVLGPCEPLIPLFILPASRDEWGAAAATAVVFGVTTVATMVAVTALGIAGVKRLPLGPLEKWAHTMAGAVVTLCGLAIITLGL